MYKLRIYKWTIFIVRSAKLLQNRRDWKTSDFRVSISSSNVGQLVRGRSPASLFLSQLDPGSLRIQLPSRIKILDRMLSSSANQRPFSSICCSMRHRVCSLLSSRYTPLSWNWVLVCSKHIHSHLWRLLRGIHDHCVGLNIRLDRQSRAVTKEIHVFYRSCD